MATSGLVEKPLSKVNLPPGALVAAIIRDRTSGDRMAQMLSIVFLVFMIVPILAPSLGQAVMAIADWHWIFAFLTALAVVMVDMMTAFWRCPPVEGAGMAPALAALARGHGWRQSRNVAKSTVHMP